MERGAGARGAGPVAVVQQFHRDVAIARNGVDYRFRRSGIAASGYSLMEACAGGAIPVVTDIPMFRLMTAGGTVGALSTAGDAASCALVAVARRDLDAAPARLGHHFDHELSWEAVGLRAVEFYRSVMGCRSRRLER